jgi:hypothetical protein
MLASATLLLAPLVAAPLHSQSSPMASAQALVENLSSARNAGTMDSQLNRFYDGSPSGGAAVRSDSDHQRLEQTRSLLSLGTPNSDGSMIGPFVFRLSDGTTRVAPTAGLEGFVYEEQQIESSAVDILPADDVAA